MCSPGANGAWDVGLAAVRVPDERVRLGREIERVDGEMDGLVYELHGLTEREIGIVEESANR